MNLLTTPESHDAALRYLASRNALHKLAEPVSRLFADQRHGEALRRQSKAREARSRRPRSFAFFGLPLTFAPSN